jgi:hypothetical protein
VERPTERRAEAPPGRERTQRQQNVINPGVAPRRFRISASFPWVETHGYRQSSLRDSDIMRSSQVGSSTYQRFNSARVCGMLLVSNSAPASRQTGRRESRREMIQRVFRPLLFMCEEQVAGFMRGRQIDNHPRAPRNPKATAVARLAFSRRTPNGAPRLISASLRAETETSAFSFVPEGLN